MPLRRSDTMRAVDAVQPLVDQFNALDEGDKLTFLDLVDPLPDKLPRSHKQKKSSKKAAGGGGSGRSASKSLCVVCGHGEASARHSDNRLDNYHPYQPPAGKSKRASGMAAQLNKQLDGRRKEPEVGGFADDADMVCDYRYPNDSAVNAGLRCGEGSINGVHDKSMGYAGYHEFQPAATSAAGGGG